MLPHDTDMNTDATNPRSSRKKRSKISNSEIEDWISARKCELTNRKAISWSRDHKEAFEHIFQFFEPLSMTSLAAIFDCTERTINRLRNAPAVSKSDLKKSLAEQVRVTAPIRTRTGHFGDPDVILSGDQLVANPFKNNMGNGMILTSDGIAAMEAFVYGMSGSLKLQHSAFKHFLDENPELRNGNQEFSYSSFCRILKQRGFTSKVPEKRFPRQGSMDTYIGLLREHNIHPDDLIFIDEKSWDSRKSTLLNKVTAPVGSQLPGISPTRLPTFHTIAAISGTDGLIAWDSYPIGEVIFGEYMLERILSYCVEYHRKTSRRSAVVLDACGQHLSDNYPFLEEFAEAEVIVFYLPTSSPYLSPIEIFWNGAQKVVQNRWQTKFFNLDSDTRAHLSSKKLGSLFASCAREYLESRILDDDDKKYIHTLYHLGSGDSIQSVFSGICDQVGGTQAAKLMASIIYGSNL